MCLSIDYMYVAYPFCFQMLNDLVEVNFSEEGSSHKAAEAAAWIHFIDFL